MRTCARCGNEIDPKLDIMRSSSCSRCRADLRSCLNCVFYKPGAHWDCRETIQEPVSDKEKANFCDFFRFRDSVPPKENKGTGKNAKEDFLKLFGSE
jgi:hypothetical protein